MHLQVFFAFAFAPEATFSANERDEMSENCEGLCFLQTFCSSLFKHNFNLDFAPLQSVHLHPEKHDEDFYINFVLFFLTFYLVAFRDGSHALAFFSVHVAEIYREMVVNGLFR